MAYDEGLADLIRAEVGAHPALTERKMFGGIGFMIHGNMAVGVSGDELMVRIGADDHDEAVARPGVRIFDGGARPMRGWVLVDPSIAGDELGNWIGRGVTYASSLPAK